MKKLIRTALAIPLTACFALLLTIACSCQAQPEAENIALGKTVTFSAKPTYEYCSDDDDIHQLTDGRYAKDGELRTIERTKSLWVQKGAVGWQNVNPLVITIDLGKVQPISGVSFSTAGGSSGVSWPTIIAMAVSDDGKAWRNAGDLMLLSRKNGVPTPEGYQEFRYRAHEMKTRGRFIAFHVVGIPFVFCDEIEVLRGEDNWLQHDAPGAIIPDITKFITPELGVTSAAQRRLYDDIDSVRGLIEKADLREARRRELSIRLERSSDATAAMTPLDTGFSTALPINDIHRDILATYGLLRAMQGEPPLTLWKQHRYDWKPLFTEPERTQRPELSFSMLKNQFRSDTFCLSNNTGSPAAVRLKINNAPAGVSQDWLQLNSVEWTDTTQGIPVADALIPLKQEYGFYTFTVPAGLTRRIWATIDSSQLPASAFTPTIEITAGEQKLSLPLRVAISPITMQRPRLSLTMWDYIPNKGESGYAVHPGNREGALQIMRSHYVDTHWNTVAILPAVTVDSFNEKGELRTALNFSRFDEWIGSFPEARRFLILIPDARNFAGAEMGSPQFNQRLGAWAKAIADHMIVLKRKPTDLGFCFGDEPQSDSQDEVVVAWGQAFKAAAPELTVFSNPAWSHPEKSKYPRAFNVADILCPSLGVVKENGADIAAFYQSRKAEGKTLWTYAANGPVRLYDPQRYYRQLAWHAFEMGATGTGFWSFSDTGGMPTSWNEYSGKVNYAAPFFDKDAVYSSVHWEALREGIEDYEELAMLRDAIEGCPDAALKREAQGVLKGALQAVTANWSSAADWSQAGDTSLTDTQLARVRSMLGRLAR